MKRIVVMAITATVLLFQCTYSYATDKYSGTWEMKTSKASHSCNSNYVGPNSGNPITLSIDEDGDDLIISDTESNLQFSGTDLNNAIGASFTVNSNGVSSSYDCTFIVLQPGKGAGSCDITWTDGSQSCTGGFFITGNKTGSKSNTDSNCNVIIKPDLSFSIPHATYKSLLGDSYLSADFVQAGNKKGQLTWQIQNIAPKTTSSSCSTTIESDLSFSLPDMTYKSLSGDTDIWLAFKFYGEEKGNFLWYLDDFGLKGSTAPDPDPGITDSIKISAGEGFTIGLKDNGAILYAGPNAFVPSISTANIKQISAGSSHVLGVYNDGTVGCEGGNSYNDQCEVSSWNNIKQVAGAVMLSYGLRNDGTVVHTYPSVYTVPSEVSSWTGIVQIDTGYNGVVGLKSDGTVIGYSNDQSEAGSWTGIKQVASGSYHIYGLKNNGTVVASGPKMHPYNGSYIGDRLDVSSWTNIKQISAGFDHVVGLKSDGTVVAAGSNYALDGYEFAGQCDVSSWSGINHIHAGPWHTIGVKGNGTVVAAGYNNTGQCDVSSWDLID